MRISDWSSDVCSSDLPNAVQHEESAQNCGGAGEEIPRPARAHQAAGAPATAQPAAFGTLHEDDSPQRGGDANLDEEPERVNHRFDNPLSKPLTRPTVCSRQPPPLYPAHTGPP